MADEPNPTAQNISATTPTLTQSGLPPAGPSTTVTSGPATGATAAPPTPTPPPAGGGNQLATDRIARFGQEAKDPWIQGRIEFLCKREGGASGRLILETACNRAHFQNASLKRILSNSSYYGDGSTTRTPTSYATSLIQTVIFGGSNETNLATDQGYNDAASLKKTGKLFMGQFIQAGVTGSWFDLNTGKKFTDPAMVNKLSTTVGNGMQEFIYRKDGHGRDACSDAGKAAKAYALKYGIQEGGANFTAGTPLPKDLEPSAKSDLTGESARTVTDGGPQIVGNTDPHGPTVVKNTNDTAKGMFAFPGVGAMVWVFFREGNPQFPVYFAASYSSSEWKSAYGGASLNPDGTNNGTVGTQVASTLKLNPNAGGGIEITHIKNNSDPSGASDKATAMMYGDDGSNMMFSKGYHQLYTRHDRRDQTDGHYYKIIGGAEEKWIEDDSSLNVRGNQIIKIGKVDAEAQEAMKQLATFSKQCNKMLLENPGK